MAPTAKLEKSTKPGPKGRGKSKIPKIDTKKSKVKKVAIASKLKQKKPKELPPPPPKKTSRPAKKDHIKVKRKKQQKPPPPARNVGGGGCRGRPRSTPVHQMANHSRTAVFIHKHRKGADRRKTRKDNLHQAKKVAHKPSKAIGNKNTSANPNVGKVKDVPTKACAKSNKKYAVTAANCKTATSVVCRTNKRSTDVSCSVLTSTWRKSAMTTNSRPDGSRRRVASLNAIAMVHVLYESDTVKSSSVSSGDCSGSDSDIYKVQPVKNIRKRKAPETPQEPVFDTRFVKRVASLNAQAIMAASRPIPKKRQKRAAPVVNVNKSPSDKNNNDVVVTIDSDDEIIQNDSKVAPEDDDDDDICIVSDVHSKYGTPPPPYHSISTNRDFCMAPASPSQQQQSRYPRATTAQSRKEDFSTCLSPSATMIHGQFTPSNRNNGPTATQYSHYSSTVPYAHSYYQPAGPLLQAVPDPFSMIHKPVAYHPHQFPDIQHQMSASHASPYLTADACHSMPTLHPLAPCLSDECQTIHHVQQSPPYNQLPTEVTSMPPRLQPLRTAQQHMSLNKNDNYTYPPPPILPQPQYGQPCQPYPRTYQSVLPDYSATPQSLQNFPPQMPMNLSSETFVPRNQTISISKHERKLSSNSDRTKHFQYENHQQFQSNIKNHKKESKTVSELLKIPAVSKIIHHASGTTTLLKVETRPKSQSMLLTVPGTKSFLKNNNAYSQGKVSISCKMPSKEQIRSNVCVNKTKQTSDQNLSISTNCQKIKIPKPSSADKKQFEEKKVILNTKKSLPSQQVQSNSIVKKFTQMKNCNSQSSSVVKISSKLSPAITAEKSETVTKKVKTKRLCDGWRWCGKGKKKLVYLNNEDGPVLRICYSAMQHNEGDIIRERDSVLVCSGARKTDIPYIAKIAALWQTPDDGEMMMSLLWYYRPEQTEHGRKPHHIDQEVFASKHRDYNSVACIEDRCYVLTYGEYCRYKAETRRREMGCTKLSVVAPPEGGYQRSYNLPPCSASLDRIFLCRKVYDYRQKRCLKNPT